MSPYLTYLSALILDSLTLAELTTREIDQWYWICFSVNFFSPRAFKVNSCPLLLMRGLQDQLFFHYYLGGAESWVGCWSKPRWQERPPSSTFCPGPSGKLTKLPWVNFAGHHWRGWERGGERRRTRNLGTWPPAGRAKASMKQMPAFNPLFTWSSHRRVKTKQQA